MIQPTALVSPLAPSVLALSPVPVGDGASFSMPDSVAACLSIAVPVLVPVPVPLEGQAPATAGNALPLVPVTAAGESLPIATPTIPAVAAGPLAADNTPPAAAPVSSAASMTELLLAVTPNEARISSEAEETPAQRQPVLVPTVPARAPRVVNAAPQRRPERTNDATDASDDRAEDPRPATETVLVELPHMAQPVAPAPGIDMLPSAAPTASMPAEPFPAAPQPIEVDQEISSVPPRLAVTPDLAIGEPPISPSDRTADRLTVARTTTQSPTAQQSLLPDAAQPRAQRDASTPAIADSPGTRVEPSPTYRGTETPAPARTRTQPQTQIPAQIDKPDQAQAQAPVPAESVEQRAGLASRSPTSLARRSTPAQTTAASAPPITVGSGREATDATVRAPEAERTVMPEHRTPIVQATLDTAPDLTDAPVIPTVATRNEDATSSRIAAEPKPRFFASEAASAIPAPALAHVARATVPNPPFPAPAAVTIVVAAAPATTSFGNLLGTTVPTPAMPADRTREGLVQRSPAVTTPAEAVALTPVQADIAPLHRAADPVTGAKPVPFASHQTGPAAIANAAAAIPVQSVAVQGAPTTGTALVVESQTLAPVGLPDTEARRSATAAPDVAQVRIALPTVEAPALVPGATAPAFRLFAAAIHAARIEERDALPANSAAPIAAVSPVQAAPAVANAQGATLDMRDERWPHVMVERIDILREAASAARDTASTTVRLVPDALGTIDVHVRTDGDTVHVHFSAEQAATRSLLADAQPRLVEAADARGLKLFGGDVGAGGQERRRSSQTATPLPVAPPSAAHDDELPNATTRIG